LWNPNLIYIYIIFRSDITALDASYVKQLEDARSASKGQLREQSLKLNDLRIAYESLQRRTQKSKLFAKKASVTIGAGGEKRQQSSRTRPQSAAISGRHATK